MKFKYFDWKVVHGFFQEELDKDPRILPEMKSVFASTRPDWVPDLGGSLRDRSDPINRLPIPMEPTRYPVPKMPDKKITFSETMDQWMASLQNKGVGKTIYIGWSGGIDSTSIMAGIFRNFSDTSNIRVLCSKNSIHENPFFYENYIKPNFKIVDSNELRLTPEMLDSTLIVDGHCGNQTFGQKWISTAWRDQKYDMLLKNWKEVEFSQVTGSKKTDALFETIKRTVPNSPVEIEKIFDFCWWAYFNFKFETVIYRTLFWYQSNFEFDNEYLDQLASQVFQRPYASESLQQWTISHLEERRTQDRITPKWHAKDYIHSIDKNPYYFQNKTINDSRYKFGGNHAYFAIDSDWNCYKLSDPNTRKWLIKLLRGEV